MSDTFNPYAAPQTENLVSLEQSTIDFPPATRLRRLGAVLIDTIIVMLAMFPAAIIITLFSRGWDEMRASPNIHFNTREPFWACVALVVEIAINWRLLANGQTIGKHLLKMRVVRVSDGSPCSRQQNILWRILPVRILCMLPFFGGLFSLFDALMIFRKNRFTMHDDIACTKVVDLRPALC